MHGDGMSLVLINQFFLALFSAIMIVAAVQDVREYRIANLFIVVLLVLYPGYFLTSALEISVLWNLGLALGFFALGVGLFSMGVMGGGDVKLIAVAVLWVGPAGLFDFLIAMSLVGAVMSLFMMSSGLRHGAAYLCTHMGMMSAQKKILTDQIPYGVAICAGGVYAAFRLAGA